MKRELTPPSRSLSTSSGKRSRINRPDGEAPSMARRMSADDTEDVQDMWDSPEVSEYSWAVTKGLTEHGNGNTRWTPAHFVAVAMWYGGVKAGIQAAKAIRIFGIWSYDEHDELPSVNDKSNNEDLLHKLWPSTPAQQMILHRWAQRSHPGTPLPDFEAAHRHLLRECIGPDLTKFPTVVRPKLNLGQRASRRWASLITQEQWRETLAPVLCKYFDPRVDLESLSKEILAGTFNGGRINAYAGNAYAKNNQGAKAGGSCAPSRAINKEINLPQTDDQDDDEEPSYPKPTAPAAVKKEPGLWDRNSCFDFSSKQPPALLPKLSDQKNPYFSGGSERPNNSAAQDVLSWSIANSHATWEVGPHGHRQSTVGDINETRVEAQPRMSTRTGNAAGGAEGPSAPTYMAPQDLNK